MSGLLGLLGLLMAGVIGGSVAFRTDTDADDDEAPDTAEDGAQDRVARDGTGQLWDAVPDAVADPAPVVDAQLSASMSAQGITGTDGNDGLEGDDSDETLLGLDGDDQMNGAGGDDTMSGGAGHDSMQGGFGHDVMSGDAGHDSMAGHEGDDSLAGGDGDDTLLGGGGDDTLEGADGDDWLAGGLGNDLLVAGPGINTLDGDFGDDTLVGAFFGAPDEGGSFLNGGEGDDVLMIGAGDVASGGTGADMFALSADAAGMARIMDFDLSQDELLVVYDAASAAPAVTLTAGELPDEVVLMVDGVPLATVVGGSGLTPDAVRLTTEVPMPFRPGG